MLDRKVTPKINFDFTTKLPAYNTHKLSNGIPIYYIQDNKQSVVGIEIAFGGAQLHEINNGAAYFSTQLLKSGIGNLDANEINEYFELRGAFVQIQSGLDSNSLSLYCLSEKLDEVLPLLIKLFYEPIFSQYQLDKLKHKKIQEIEINNQKTTYWATKLLKESMFGNHAYGRILTKKDTDEITRDKILEHWYTISQLTIEMITVAGSFSEEFIFDSFEKTLVNPIGYTIPIKPPIINRPLLQTTCKTLGNSDQASIKIGLKSIELTHSNYSAFSLTNTIFGGYFGSRLMQSIREDKGFTYGINSSIIHLQQSSYLIISADIKKGVGDEVINLINIELEKLTTKVIEEEELNKVKNYIISKYKSDTETIFDKINKIKFLKSNKLADNFFTNFHKTLLDTDSNSINKLASSLLNPANFHSVIVE